MANCPLYNGTNLDYTGNKYNNPYTLIQKAGRRRKQQSKTLRKRYKKKRSTRKRKHL